MLLLRYASILSAILLSFSSFTTARPGPLEDSSISQRQYDDNQCPAGSDNDYTQCFDLAFNTLFGKATSLQKGRMNKLIPGQKLNFWICYNKNLQTVWIDGVARSDTGWLIDLLVVLQASQRPKSCRSSSPWAPPSWGKKGENQCKPPPRQCLPGYKICNGCCQKESKGCPTYKPKTRRDAQVCRAGQTECYIGSGLYECMNTNSDVESCGGCVFRPPALNGKGSFALGQDCTDIPNASAVQCQKGHCVVERCTSGHTLVRSNNTCVPSTTSLKLQKYRLPESSWTN